jgi:hypothetical protein
VKSLLLIAALALLWAFGGFIVGVGLSAFTGTAWMVPCAAPNMLAGMLLLLLVTRDLVARHIFYEGPQRDELGIFSSAVTPWSPSR